MTAATDQLLEERARFVAARCERLGLLFSSEANKEERTENRLRLVNIVVGAITALVTISGPIESWVGSNTVQTISVIAAVVLILDGLIPYFRGKVSPDRLRDYAFYIHNYVGMIITTLTDTSLTDTQRCAKLLAHLNLAELNLSDVCSKFPLIYQEAVTSFDAKMIKSMAAQTDAQPAVPADAAASRPRG